MGCSSSSTRNSNITPPTKNESSNKAKSPEISLKKEGLTLYYFPMSAPSRAVMAFLDLTGLKYEKKVVDIFKGEHKAAAYLKINPNGLVPAISDSGFSVFESDTIIRYLLNTKKVGADLYPSDAKEAALIDRYLPFHHIEVRPACMNFFIANYSSLFPDAKVTLEGAKSTLEETLKKFDSNYLADRKYLAGDKLSTADLFAMGELSMIYYTTDTYDFNKYPRVKAYIERVAQNKAITAVNKPVIEFKASLKKENTATEASKGEVKTSKVAPEEAKSNNLKSSSDAEKSKASESTQPKASESSPQKTQQTEKSGDQSNAPKQAEAQPKSSETSPQKQPEQPKAPEANTHKEAEPQPKPSESSPQKQPEQSKVPEADAHKEAEVQPKPSEASPQKQPEHPKTPEVNAHKEAEPQSKPSEASPQKTQQDHPKAPEPEPHKEAGDQHKPSEASPQKTHQEAPKAAEPEPEAHKDVESHPKPAETSPQKAADHETHKDSQSVPPKASEEHAKAPESQEAGDQAKTSDQKASEDKKPEH